jgi:hypothetical protein
MRNDQNKVLIKSELNASSSINWSQRESLKENRANNSQQNLSLREPDLNSDRRSQSVEIIPVRPLEIDITDEDKIKTTDAVMGPPPVPVKKTRQRVQKTKSADIPEDPSQPIPLRVTRSKIKKEKKSVDAVVVTNNELSTLTDETKTIQDQSVDAVKKPVKKKYPMPILVKIEDLKEKPSTQKPELLEKMPEPEVEIATNNDQTFNVAENEKITISSNPSSYQIETFSMKNNETITLEKNPHESLMTEDNDDDEGNASMNMPLAQVAQQVPLPPNLKYKNKEVFK